MLCVENTYLYIKRPEEAQEYNTRVGDKETLESNSNSLDVAIDAQAYDDWLEEKVRMTVYIPRWLRLALIDYILERYGGDVPHGALSEAVRELLAWALETRAATQPDRPSRASLSRNREECERILAFLKTFITPAIEPRGSVATVLLAKAITMARGRKETKYGLGTKADPRTIKKWLKRLEELRYIAQTSDGTWAILHVPDDKRCEELLGDLWRLAQGVRLGLGP